MQDVFVSVIIPAYNEELIIKDTINQLLSFLAGSFSQYELIIADDGSTDGTRAAVESMGSDRLRCVRHFPNKGKGCAVREGVLAAKGRVVVYTDADLAYGTAVIADLVRLLEEKGTDLAIGSRKLHPQGYADYPPLRLLASRCFSLVTSIFAGFSYDTQCGLKAFTAGAAGEVFSRCETDGFAFDFELMMLAQRMGFSVAQLPVSIVNHRQSKVNVLRDSIRMLRDLMKIRHSVNKRLRGDRLK